jgi:small subunit ribosomal protein S2
MTPITLRQLFEAKVHLGHLSRFREPKMAEFIYGTKNGMNIIDLEKTRRYIQSACQFISQISERPGSEILFVGTKRGAQSIIKEQAIRAGMPYVDHHWLGGMLTNYRTIRQSIKRLKELEAMQQEGHFKGLTKKEALTLQRKLCKLERAVGGIKNMAGPPDALFILEVSQPITEAKKLKIPVIAIVDTNHSPKGIDYIIPGNDDSAAAMRLYATLAADAVLEGRSRIQVSDTALKKQSEPIIKTAKKTAIHLNSIKSEPSESPQKVNLVEASEEALS